MIKNAIIYRALTDPAKCTLDEFEPCGANQEKSMGWAPPRGEAHGPLVEVIDGQRILKLMTETKSVPSAVVTRKAQERAAQIEQAQGRKPGKKEMREIKEDVKMALLPHAFAKRSATWVWFSPDGFLVIDASSQSKADDVVTMLVNSFDGLMISFVTTTQSPQACMAQWLIDQEPPAGFSVDRECELKAFDESKAVVKYGHHALDIDEVQAHITSGKRPTRLAMTWESRVSFVLTDTMAIKKIQILDTVFDAHGSEHDADAFDADVVIMTGEMKRLIKDLTDALGGEFVDPDTATAT